MLKLLRTIKPKTGATNLLFSIIIISCSYEVNSLSSLADSPIKINLQGEVLQLGLKASLATQLYYCVNKTIEQCQPASADESFTSAQGIRHTVSGNVIFNAQKPFKIEHLKSLAIIGLEGLSRYITFIDPTKVSASLEDSIALIKEDSIRQEIAFIASKEFRGRDTGSQENVKAADYIIEELKKLNIKPLKTDGNYRQDFTVNGRDMDNVTTSNILGIIEGTDPALKDRYIVVGAHFDHVGSRACQGGGLCQGADDNASGTVGLLHIARSLVAMRSTLKRNVLLMWFSGEELGLLGSKFYVNNNPIVPLDKIDYMINLDMIGYLRSNLELGGSGRSEIGRTLAQKTLEKYPNIRARTSAQYGPDSDHAPFFDSGIAGTFFHTGLHNNYHRSTDTPKATGFNYSGMTTVAKIALEHAYDIINTTTQISKIETVRNYMSEENSIHGHSNHNETMIPAFGEFVGCAQTLDW